MVKRITKSKTEMLELIKTLATLSPGQLKLVMNHLNPRSYNFLAEVFHNLTYNTIGLSKKEMKKIKLKMFKNKNEVQELINPKTTSKKRRYILARQMGSGLITAAVTTLLPILIGALSG